MFHMNYENYPILIYDMTIISLVVYTGVYLQRKSCSCQLQSNANFAPVCDGFATLWKMGDWEISHVYSLSAAGCGFLTVTDSTTQCRPILAGGWPLLSTTLLTPAQLFTGDCLDNMKQFSSSFVTVRLGYE